MFFKYKFTPCVKFVFVLSVIHYLHGFILNEKQNISQHSLSVGEAEDRISHDSFENKAMNRTACR